MPGGPAAGRRGRAGCRRGPRSPSGPPCERNHRRWDRRSWSSRPTPGARRGPAVPAALSSVTLLRRLGHDSRKNRLYRAFRELGRAVRTLVLLRYLSEPENQRNPFVLHGSRPDPRPDRRPGHRRCDARADRVRRLPPRPRSTPVGHREPSTRSAPCPPRTPYRPNSPLGSAATGPSRSACTGSVTSPWVKTSTGPVPAAAPRSWPLSAPAQTRLCNDPGQRPGAVVGRRDARPCPAGVHLPHSRVRPGVASTPGRVRETSCASYSGHAGPAASGSPRTRCFGSPSPRTCLTQGEGTVPVS